MRSLNQSFQYTHQLNPDNVNYKRSFYVPGSSPKRQNVFNSGATCLRKGTWFRTPPVGSASLNASCITFSNSARRLSSCAMRLPAIIAQRTFTTATPNIFFTLNMQVLKWFYKLEKKIKSNMQCRNTYLEEIQRVLQYKDNIITQLL